MPQRHTVRFHLRAGTGAAHDRVDAAFGGHDLTDPAAYAAFLTAHARVVLPLEQVLDADALWPEWRARGGLLRTDLARLGVAVPTAMPVVAGPPAERWGLLYVLEGSRLGGAMLARQVGAGLPTGYLGAAHGGGSWARFGDAIDAAGADGGAAWREDALKGALRGFAMFEGAVRGQGS